MAYLKLSLDSDDRKTKMTSIWTSLESLQTIRWRRANKKKQTLRRSPVYINFCKIVTVIARQNVYFSCVILYTLRGRVGQDETTRPKGGNS